MDHFSKFLDEDVDETLHSGAAVDALTAQLNREVGGSFPQTGAPKPQTGQNPNLESQHSSEKQKPKPPALQMQSANQQPPAGDKKPATPKAAPTIPFQMLMPILRPHLDKDRDMQLQQIFTKLRSNEVTKEDFLRVIRNIVGDQMLRQAAHTVHMKMQSDALKSSSSSQSQTSSPNPNVPPSSNPNPNPSSNPNTYSLLSQSSSSSQQFLSQPQKLSLGSSPSPSQLQDKTPVNKIVNRPSHQQQPLYNNNPSSYPPRPVTNNPSALIRPPSSQTTGTNNPPALIRPPSSQTTGQVVGGNWARGVGSTFGPAYVKQEQAGAMPRISAPGPGAGAMVGGPGAHGPGAGAMVGGPGAGVMVGHAAAADSTMQTPIMASKAPVKKPAVGQKKPLEGSSPPPASKKQKTGGHLDQSIEQLNDVTAVSGVNLREEEEQLLSAPKEDSRISEATRRVVQEEEEWLILQKGPLHKKLMEILAKSNLSGVGSDVERCLSMCVEERLKDIIANLVRLSKQRVDLEKSKHRVIVSSDVHTHIMNENKKAKEEWDKKQAEEAEKMKQNEVEETANADAEKDKDDKNSKNIKVNKEEDDKMRTTAANVAARAAVGGDDMLIKWQMMAEQARQKREHLDSSSSSNASKTSLKPLSKVGSKEEEEERRREERGKEEEEGRKARRSVGLRDVIAVLEREPGLARSGMVYKLYERVRE